MDFALRLLVNAAALWVAIQIVPGVSYSGSVWSLLAVALVVGVLNASVRPLLMLFTFPLLILTLGLFTFVINAFVLMLAGWVSNLLGLGFHVTGFGSAFLGALVVSLVSFMLSLFVKEQEGRGVHVHLG
ncbi:MAG: phage holin family protein [Vicinamibacterales bacterium]|nr:phage holin family protein [Vicinamibacterales bacterium]